MFRGLSGSDHTCFRVVYHSSQPLSFSPCAMHNQAFYWLQRKVQSSTLLLEFHLLETWYFLKRNRIFWEKGAREPSLLERAWYHEALDRHLLAPLFSQLHPFPFSIFINASCPDRTPSVFVEHSISPLSGDMTTKLYLGTTTTTTTLKSWKMAGKRILAVVLKNWHLFRLDSDTFSSIFLFP